LGENSFPLATTPFRITIHCTNQHTLTTTTTDYFFLRHKVNGYIVLGFAIGGLLFDTISLAS
jgi:hypothetical protein